MKVVRRNQTLLSLAVLFIVTLVIEVRFDNVGLGKCQVAFSKHLSEVGIDFQGDSFEDEDCLCDYHYKLSTLSFEIKTPAQLHSEEVMQQSDFLPLRPIILISCLRI